MKPAVRWWRRLADCFPNRTALTLDSCKPPLEGRGIVRQVSTMTIPDAGRMWEGSESSGECCRDHSSHLLRNLASLGEVESTRRLASSRLPPLSSLAVFLDSDVEVPALVESLDFNEKIPQGLLTTRSSLFSLFAEPDVPHPLMRDLEVCGFLQAKVLFLIAISGGFPLETS